MTDPPTYRTEPDPEFADRLERHLLHRLTALAGARRLRGRSAGFSDDPLGSAGPEPAERAPVQELAAPDISDQRHRSYRRRLVAAAAIAVIGAAGIASIAVSNRGSDDEDVSTATDATPPPRGTEEYPPALGAWWPQSTPDAQREAQARADAGDPDYTWQVDPALASGSPSQGLDVAQTEIVQRFLREVLGWEDFVHDYQEWQTVAYAPDRGFQLGLTFLRCAPGARNPLYQDDADQLPGARCAPTIDELHYESVTIDLRQPVVIGPDGIWVVSFWHTNPPFTQADPSVVEADATAALREFLQARVDGHGAERFDTAYTFHPREVPLLYATTTGAPYERFEIERVSEPRWPYADMSFAVRLFADGGETVVEQQIDYGITGDTTPPNPDYEYGINMEPWRTTENGRAVPVPLEYLEVPGLSVSAAAPWLRSEHFVLAVAPEHGALERVALTYDPIQVSCDPLPAAGDADSLVAAIRSDADLVVTDPVETTIGGVTGLQLDVRLAPGASACPEPRKGDDEPNMLFFERTGGPGTGFPLEQGSRMRLYVVDVPDGSLKAAVVAPADRFDAVVAETAPIIDSIQFTDSPA